MIAFYTIINSFITLFELEVLLNLNEKEELLVVNVWNRNWLRRRPHRSDILKYALVRLFDEELSWIKVRSP